MSPRRWSTPAVSWRRRMLILLPPSEGKSPPEAGKPLELGSLAFAERLTAKRSELLDVLTHLGELPREDAVRALGLSAGQAGEVDVDAALREARAAPAAEVYAGVLYDRLGLGSLPASARRRASDSVLVASALWGVVRLEDRIPYYRLSMKARLPGVGALARWWRGDLVAALPDEPGALIVDMRSAAYAAAWKPRRATVFAVRAFSETGGERKAVSHMAKAIRGEVARALLLAPVAPAEAEEVAAIVRDAGFAVELGDATLDVILR